MFSTVITFAAVGALASLAVVFAGVVLHARMRRLTARLNDAIAAADAHEQELSRRAQRDPLTDLPNRALVADQLEVALAIYDRAGAVAVLLVDLDHFRLVNDTFGHGAGDDVLRTIGARLEAQAPPGATVARFGGDEFIVVCRCTAGTREAFTAAQQFLGVIEEPLLVDGTTITVTGSIGVATSTGDSSAEDLIREADTALFAAKEFGRARVHQFTGLLHRKASRRLTIENELRGALARDQLRLAYQPIVDVATGTMAGVEALLRWNHPALGSVSPPEFVPIAEEAGLIWRIGEYALERACHQAAAWRDYGFPVRMSVNVSGRQMSDHEFPALVARTLAKANLPSELLCLELTESVLMSDATRTVDCLVELKSMGVTLSIDDFGTGYSSLAYLERFPVDELKIDRTFVRVLADRTGTRSLVAAMVAMGRALGLEVVAEGVETIDQLDAVRELGCDRAQGYLFGKPHGVDEITAALDTAGARVPIDLT